MNEAARPRCRQAGIVIGELPPGRHNAITDVPGVRVGHKTVDHVTADGSIARTGATAIWPATEDLVRRPVPAGTFVLNGYGEVTGKAVIDELGIIHTPILLTSTMNVGMGYHALQQYMVRSDAAIGVHELVLPVVCECDDSFLNDARAFHLQPEHVFAALDGAASGPVEEGCVGAGAGMQCFDFKGGIGTASRLVASLGDGLVVGVLVLTNFGARPALRIDGVPVGRHLTDLRPEGARPDYWGEAADGGSCIVIVATNVPLRQRQLDRLAARSALGLARTGSIGANSSGELMVAFSTANRRPLMGGAWQEVSYLQDRLIDVVYQAVIEATEEAVVNALFAATTTRGRDGNVLHALPLDRTLRLMREHGRGP